MIFLYFKEKSWNNFNETVLYAIIFMSLFFSILFLGGFLVPIFGFLSYDTLIWLQLIVLGLKTSLILFNFFCLKLRSKIFQLKLKRNKYILNFFILKLNYLLTYYKFFNYFLINSLLFYILLIV